ncbi:transcriptional regulator [Chelativorans sp.]|uniref:winged helix-turn-helix domain-containing protein n=1 Tax=Chelativorans sp. TaxID=2203393 RepID=UPI0028111E1B|nr:transcriptional regulator [Chelativorans sp.]
MATGGFRFDRFVLDPSDRQLRRDGLPVELNARYLDALALLVREQGRLVSKNRFLDEVWRGVPVTDEALTQCIKTLRRQLGDDAASPRFIETVPKHGYRFIAPVERVGDGSGPDAVTMARSEAQPQPWRRVLLLGSAGTIGGGIAGIFGGLFYGFAGAFQPLQPGMGAVSVLLVLLCLNIVVGLLGGAGVGFGIALAGVASGRPWQWGIAGGAAGGMVVGALVKLLGLDAFNLLFGQSPGDIAGAPEGALLGGAVGFGAWLGNRGAGSPLLGRCIAAAAVAGAAAGMLIALIGGRLMGGSLDLLARSFPGSRLRLGDMGGLFGESGFGPVSQVLTAGLEGLLFGGCVVGAMVLARRSLSGNG